MYIMTVYVYIYIYWLYITKRMNIATLLTFEIVNIENIYLSVYLCLDFYKFNNCNILWNIYSLWKTWKYMQQKTNEINNNT